MQLGARRPHGGPRAPPLFLAPPTLLAPPRDENRAEPAASCESSRASGPAPAPSSAHARRLPRWRLRGAARPGLSPSSPAPSNGRRARLRPPAALAHARPFRPPGPALPITRNNHWSLAAPLPRPPPAPVPGTGGGAATAGSGTATAPRSRRHERPPPPRVPGPAFLTRGRRASPRRAPSAPPARPLPASRGPSRPLGFLLPGGPPAAPQPPPSHSGSPPCGTQSLGSEPVPGPRSPRAGRGWGPAGAAALEPPDRREGPAAPQPARGGLPGSGHWLIFKHRLSCNRGCPGPGCPLAVVTPDSHVGGFSGPELGTGRSSEAREFAGSPAWPLWVLPGSGILNGCWSIVTERFFFKSPSLPPHPPAVPLYTA